MALRAGRLRHRVQLFEAAQISKPRGGVETIFQPVGQPIPSEVRGLGGHEATIGHALDGISVFSITCRFRTDITTAHQLGWEGLTLNVKNVDTSDPRREQIVILADTGSPQATANG